MPFPQLFLKYLFTTQKSNNREAVFMTCCVPGVYTCLLFSWHSTQKKIKYPFSLTPCGTLDQTKCIFYMFCKSISLSECLMYILSSHNRDERGCTTFHSVHYPHILTDNNCISYRWRPLGIAMNFVKGRIHVLLLCSTLGALRPPPPLVVSCLLYPSTPWSPNNSQWRMEYHQLTMTRCLTYIILHERLAGRNRRPSYLIVIVSCSVVRGCQVVL